MDARPVIQTVMEVGGFDALEATDAGMREGVFFEALLAEHDPPLFDDVRRASVMNLANLNAMGLPIPSSGPNATAPKSSNKPPLLPIAPTAPPLPPLPKLPKLQGSLTPQQQQQQNESTLLQLLTGGLQ